MLRPILIIVTVLFFLSHTSFVSAASLVSITNKGEIEWNVLPARDEILASSPEPETLRVKNIAQNTNSNESAQVQLRNNAGKVTLTVNDGTNTQEADVTGYADEIIEIEQQTTPARIAILASDGGFLIREQNVTAHTAYPLAIEPEIKRIVVETNSGKHFLGVLPSEALSQVVKGNILDVIGDNDVQITEVEAGELQYAIAGKKTLNILHIFEYEVPVTARVSAIDGQILAVDQPVWLPIASFLFA